MATPCLAIMMMTTKPCLAISGRRSRAGDVASMTRVVQFCVSHSIAIGAHPSYPDRDHFGRRSLDIDAEDLHASLVAQLRSLARIARSHEGRIEYVKPHGALYHDASRDPALAVLIVDAIEAALERATIIGPRAVRCDQLRTKPRPAPPPPSSSTPRGRPHGSAAHGSAQGSAGVCVSVVIGAVCVSFDGCVDVFVGVFVGVVVVAGEFFLHAGAESIAPANTTVRKIV